MAELSQIASLLGFITLFVVSTALALLAYMSVRRMDQVVLRARMYMNRNRLFNGLLASAVAMVVLTVVVVASSLSTLLRPTGSAADPTVSASLTIGFAASFVFLAWGFYNFYALSRTPREAPQESGQ